MVIKKWLISFCTILILSCYSSLVIAASVSPVGSWVTFDDKTKKARSVVKIWHHKGRLYGKVVKILNKEPGDTGYCNKCPGKFKGKPVKGLTIMWGLKRTSQYQWEGGKIMDPKNGKIYRCKIKLAANGKQLKVRGFIGFSLLGRTQIWVRAR